MTEEQWLKGYEEDGNFFEMPSFLICEARNTVTKRKLRLCACALARLVWGRLDKGGKGKIEAAEKFADGLISHREMALINNSCFYRPIPSQRREWLKHNNSDYTQMNVLRMAFSTCLTPAATALHRVSAQTPYMVGSGPDVCRIISFIFPNPFKPPPPFDDIWRTETVIRVARHIYDNREFSILPILGDALEDAGCNNVEILSHLRSQEQHFLGDWVLDLILGIETEEVYRLRTTKSDVKKEG